MGNVLFLNLGVGHTGVKIYQATHCDLYTFM